MTKGFPEIKHRIHSFVWSIMSCFLFRSSEGHRRWSQRSLTSLRSVNRSLDVGLPSPSVEGRSETGGVGGALFRLTGRPLCRAFLLTSVVMMLVLLTGIIIFLLTFRNDGNSEWHGITSHPVFLLSLISVMEKHKTHWTVKFQHLEGLLCLNVVNEQHLFHCCG